MHLWFLIVSLFLPRVSLALEWLGGHHLPFAHPWDILCWVFIPRLMVLVMVFRWKGFGFWFWLQLFAALLAYGTGGKKLSGN
jgi:hypothetical protein